MKKLLLLSVAVLTTSAVAGVRIEHVTRDIKTKAQQGSTQTMFVQNGQLRSNASSSGGMILKGATIIILDDKRKQYREMNKEDMKKMAAQAGAAMARMQEQLKNMTPEQRAMMEKAMGSQIAGGIGAAGKPDAWDAKNLGTSDVVEGRRCQLWNLSRNGALFEELCVVPYSSLAGKEDFQKVFKEMADAFADLAKSVPNADASVKARTAINGYSVRSRLYDGKGQLRGTETILTKWVEESVPASTFEVPPGYTKAQLPSMKMD
jgi:hypothetical protein